MCQRRGFLISGGSDGAIAPRSWEAFIKTTRVGSGEADLLQAKRGTLGTYPYRLRRAREDRGVTAPVLFISPVSSCSCLATSGGSIAKAAQAIFSVC